MKSLEEFSIGKHNIGYVSDGFKNSFNNTEFEARSMPTFQKLPRSMKDEEIDSELNLGICELGDIIAFMDNAPDECKDGSWNLFYTSFRVVSVYWYGYEWFVSAWYRVGRSWSAGRRVFSPATSDAGSISSVDSVPMTLKIHSKYQEILEWLYLNTENEMTKVTRIKLIEKLKEVLK